MSDRGGWVDTSTHPPLSDRLSQTRPIPRSPDSDKDILSEFWFLQTLKRSLYRSLLWSNSPLTQNLCLVDVEHRHVEPFSYLGASQCALGNPPWTQPFPFWPPPSQASPIPRLRCLLLLLLWMVFSFAPPPCWALTSTCRSCTRWTRWSRWFQRRCRVPTKTRPGCLCLRW